MGIVVYGRENCPLCEKIKILLVKENISFDYKEDMTTAVKLAKDNAINTLPLVVIDNEVYDFNTTKNKIEKGEI
jgi:glutaredoxin